MGKRKLNFVLLEKRKGKTKYFTFDCVLQESSRSNWPVHSDKIKLQKVFLSRPQTALDSCNLPQLIALF